MPAVSHERIYQHLWHDKQQCVTLYASSIHNGRKYNKREGINAGRELIPNRMNISQRPQIVEQKSRIGDWEADTIVGARHENAILRNVQNSVSPYPPRQKGTSINTHFCGLI